MKIYTVYDKYSTKIKECCLMNDNNDYVGQETGNKYNKNEHYHKRQIKAKIINVDKENLTGMYHLYKEWENNIEENDYLFKIKFIGCYVTLEEAHYADGLLIYRCMELDEYFSENEIEIL